MLIAVPLGEIAFAIDAATTPAAALKRFLADL
jgi:hypothetical protein